MNEEALNIDIDKLASPARGLQFIPVLWATVCGQSKDIGSLNVEPMNNLLRNQFAKGSFEFP